MDKAIYFDNDVELATILNSSNLKIIDELTSNGALKRSSLDGFGFVVNEELKYDRTISILGMNVSSVFKRRANTSIECSLLINKIPHPIFNSFLGFSLRKEYRAPRDEYKSVIIWQQILDELFRHVIGEKLKCKAFRQANCVRCNDDVGRLQILCGNCIATLNEMVKTRLNRGHDKTGLITNAILPSLIVKPFLESLEGEYLCSDNEMKAVFWTWTYLKAITTSAVLEKGHGDEIGKIIAKILVSHLVQTINKYKLKLPSSFMWLMNNPTTSEDVLINRLNIYEDVAKKAPLDSGRPVDIQSEFVNSIGIAVYGRTCPAGAALEICKRHVEIIELFRGILSQYLIICENS